MFKELKGFDEKVSGAKMKIYKKSDNYFCGVHKNHEIIISRDDTGDFYIQVIHVESGIYGYDGYWEGNSMDEAIKEAIQGSMI